MPAQEEKKPIRDRLPSIFGWFSEYNTFRSLMRACKDHGEKTGVKIGVIRGQHSPAPCILGIAITKVSPQVPITPLPMADLSSTRRLISLSMISQQRGIGHKATDLIQTWSRSASFVLTRSLVLRP